MQVYSSVDCGSYAIKWSVPLAEMDRLDADVIVAQLEEEDALEIRVRAMSRHFNSDYEMAMGAATVKPG